MPDRHLHVVTALLVIAGLLLFGYKVIHLDFPLNPGVSANAWEVEIKLNFEAYDQPVKVELNIPSSRADLPILNENFISRGFGRDTARSAGNRVAIWSKRQASGSQTLYYRALVEVRESADNGDAVPRPDVRTPVLDEAERLAASEVLDDARRKSADMDTLVGQLVQRFNSAGSADEFVSLLQSRRASARGRVERVVELLALADIPARSLHGIELVGEHGSAELVHRIEVWQDGRWTSYTGDTGQRAEQRNYLLIWRGPDWLADVSGGDHLQLSITKEPVPITGLSAAESRERLFSPDLWAFSLSNLPLATQNVYRILLVVPIGAFILVLMRNVVGLTTFGTFMPVLIALAFRETHLFAGIVLFVTLVALGLVIRFYLDRLKLLLVPRLAAVLIVVILLMLTVTMVSHKLGIESGLSIALFPMVIITMTIERMSIVWEEHGPKDALQQGFGSLVSATIAYAAMSLSYVVHLLTTFPELLLLLLAATMQLGRYSGYRLLELRRFRHLIAK